MAERDIVGGLFGVTPEMYQQARQQQQMNEAIKMGSLTPAQFIGTQAYRGGQALGNVAGSLLGVEDPQMQLISRTNQLVQQIGVDTPEKLKTLAGELQKLPGGAPLASQAIGQANRMLESAATVTAKNREQIKQVGLSADGLQVYQSGDEQYTLGPQGKIPYYGKLESKQSKTEVNVGGLDKVFTEAFNKAEGKDQAEAWSKAGVAYGEAAKLSKNLREIESLVGNSFVGPYGSLQAGVSRVFGGSQKLSNTEIVDALTKQLVVPLVKQFPGSLAVKELDTLMKTTPNIAQKEETIRRLLGRIQEEVKATELAYEAGERYREKKGSIVGFNPNIANNRAMRFVELEKKLNQSKDKKLSEAERKEAESIAVELGLK